MFNIRFSSFLLIILFFCALKSKGQDASLVYKNVVNSTVTIQTDVAQGSGFFVGQNIIVTNFHVIEGASDADCYLNNSDIGYHIDGYLAYDIEADLVILQVSELNNPPLKISSEDALIGQRIYAIGSPLGLPATFSEGIVSGMRDFDGKKLIQMTASISHGSSGGPVLNSKGELIGVSVGAFSEGQNINFFIPKTYVEIMLKFKKATPVSLSNLLNMTNTPSEDVDQGPAEQPINRIPETLFITHEDSLSYAFGMSIIENAKNAGFENLSEVIILQAILDSKAGITKLEKDKATVIINAEVRKNSQKKSDMNKKRGEDYLGANGKKSGVKTTSSGLQYKVNVDGQGVMPDKNDKVTVHYHGTTIDGVIFDSSVDRGKPATFGLNQVIPGWTEGLQLMKEGSKFTFFIPQGLAYGSRAQGKIEAFSTLVFEVELIKVEKID